VRGNVVNNSAYTIDEIKTSLTPIAREYGVKRLALFGSYVKGKATPESDIDLHLIDTGDIWGYFKLCGFKQALKARFGVNVDVLTTGSMDNEVLEAVIKEEVLIFEQ
jgi:predicted nucleotidyltransferase